MKRKKTPYIRFECQPIPHRLKHTLSLKCRGCGFVFEKDGMYPTELLASDWPLFKPHHILDFYDTKTPHQHQCKDDVIGIADIQEFHFPNWKEHESNT